MIGIAHVDVDVTEETSCVFSRSVRRHPRIYDSAVGNDDNERRSLDEE